MIRYEDFAKVEVRTGTILQCEVLQGTKKRFYYLTIDFGPLGIKHSCAQLMDNYKKEDLIGKQILAVVNMPPLKIKDVYSEVLVLGVPDEQGGCVLIVPDKKVENGKKWY